MFISRSWKVTALGLLLTASAALAQAEPKAKGEDCGRLAQMKLAHARIVSAEVVSAGPIKSGAGESPAAKTDFCRIQVLSKPTADSEIQIEVWVPVGENWNRKFEQVGNGGFAGVLPYRAMTQALSLGLAVAGTDDGHQANDMTDAAWALGHPEKVKDYGWRAIRETTVIAKQIVQTLKARAPAKSYFVGCSDGGREALMMAQRFPAAFDGIIAGAPAYSMTRLLTSGALRSRDLGGAISYLPPAQLALLQRQALKQCGDGMASYLKDPRQCAVDVAALRCANVNANANANANEPAGCLSDAQVKTVQTIYAQRKDPATGQPLYGVLPGAEAVKGSWDAWLTGNGDDKRPAAGGFTWNYLAYMVRGDPKLDGDTVTDAELERGERQYAPIMDSDNPDLSAFKAHGGKLIQYHGWNDPAIPPGYSLEYRERLAAKTGGLQDFYRLYLVPGMLHCGGGEAPTMVNWPAAIEGWVEKGEAPGELVASDAKGGTQVLEPVE
jgi:feruloyl esterase